MEPPRRSTREDEAPAGHVASEPQVTLLRTCGWCGRIEVDGVWQQRDAEPSCGGADQSQTHGICPTCYTAWKDTAVPPDRDAQE